MSIFKRVETELKHLDVKPVSATNDRRIMVKIGDKVLPDVLRWFGAMGYQLQEIKQRSRFYEFVKEEGPSNPNRFKTTCRSEMVYVEGPDGQTLAVSWDEENNSFLVKG